MAIVSRAQLKKWFQTKAYPTAEQFAAWIDSYFHKGEDKISIDEVDGLADLFNDKYPATAGAELEQQVAGIDTRVSDLNTAMTSQFAQIATEQDAQDAEIEALRVRAHFRGYLATNAAIQALTEPTQGDYAYSAESGTKWLYDEIAAMWSDTGLAVPDQTVPPSDDLPLPDGTANPGEGTAYSRFDHVHPHDAGKQDTLVSGANIKTINGQNLLGSGDITIEGGASASPVFYVQNEGDNVVINNPDDVIEWAKTAKEGDKVIVWDIYTNDPVDAPLVLPVEYEATSVMATSITLISNNATFFGDGTLGTIGIRQSYIIAFNSLTGEIDAYNIIAEVCDTPSFEAQSGNVHQIIKGVVSLSDESTPDSAGFFGKGLIDKLQLPQQKRFPRYYDLRNGTPPPGDADADLANGLLRPGDYIAYEFVLNSGIVNYAGIDSNLTYVVQGSPGNSQNNPIVQVGDILDVYGTLQRVKSLNPIVFEDIVSSPNAKSYTDEASVQTAISAGTVKAGDIIMVGDAPAFITSNKTIVYFALKAEV